jgi:hypothetical protein
MPEKNDINAPTTFYPTSISSLRSSIVGRGGGVQLANRYDVEFITPFGNFLTYPTEVNIPQRALATYTTGQPSSMWGTKRKVPIQHEFDEITMSFIIYQDWAEKAFFEQWMDYIVNKDQYNDRYQEFSRVYLNYVGKIYISTIKKDAQGGSNGYTSKTLLDEAYPLSILPVSLAAENTGYTTLVVTFAFRKSYNLEVDNSIFIATQPRGPSIFTR